MHTKLYIFISIITEFVTRVTRRVSLGAQELHILPEHTSSPPVFMGFTLLNCQCNVCCVVLLLLLIALFALF